MKAWSLIILSAFILFACRQDPIDRLLRKVSREDVPSYPFKAIDLPKSATPEQLIAALSKRGVLELGYFNFTSYKIVEIRSVKTDPPFVQKFTAVRLDTNDGQKVVLLRPMQSGTNWNGWYYRTYDAK